MPRGGARVGAGRPRKDAAAHWLSGDAGKRHGKDKPKAAQAEPAEFVHEPVGLTREAGEVWRVYAPHAMQARTLTTATAGDMAELCELVVEMRGILQARRKAGWDEEGLRLSREYRGLVQRVESKMRGFRLAPMGKEMTTAVPEHTDPWAEFDGAPVQ